MENIESLRLFSNAPSDLLLQRLMDSIEKNEIGIRSLERIQNMWMGKCSKDIEEIRESIRLIEKHALESKKRIDRIEGNLCIPGAASSMTVGQGVAANRRSLARTLNLVAHKAEAEEVKAITSRLQTELKQTIDQTVGLLPSSTIIEKVNDAISALGKRLDVLSLEVQNKIDSSHFKSISAEAEVIRSHAHFVKESELSINEFRSLLQKLARDFISESESVRVLADRTTELEDNIKSKVLDVAFHKLNEEITLLKNHVESKGNAQNITVLENVVRESDLRLNSVEQDIKTLISAHETLAKHLTKRLDNTYKKAAVDDIFRKFLRMDSFVNALQHVTEEVDTKATIDSLENLASTVEKMRQEHSVTRKKTDLAARFIEWYTRSSKFVETNTIT